MESKIVGEKLEYYPYEEKPSGRRKIIAIVILLAAIFTGAIVYKYKSGQKSVTIASWSNYRSEDYGFSINYPENWVISERENVQLIGGFATGRFTVNFKNPQITTTPYVLFSVNVAVMPASVPLEAAIPGMEGALRVLGDVLEKGYIQVKGINGYHWIVKTKVPAEMKMRWVLFVQGNIAYTLAFLNTEDSFDEYANAFDEFVNSLSIG